MALYGVLIQFYLNKIELTLQNELFKGWRDEDEDDDGDDDNDVDNDNYEYVYKDSDDDNDEDDDEDDDDFIKNTIKKNTFY